jgi:hypothetical protein
MRERADQVETEVMKADQISGYRANRCFQEHRRNTPAIFLMLIVCAVKLIATELLPSMTLMTPSETTSLAEIGDLHQ